MELTPAHQTGRVLQTTRVPQPRQYQQQLDQQVTRTSAAEKAQRVYHALVPVIWIALTTIIGKYSTAACAFAIADFP